MTIHQDIRFCSSSDGVQLAMSLSGTGPYLVKAATWLTHIEKDVYSPHTRQWIDELSRKHTYVTYDTRGCGLSDKSASDVSLDAWVRDLEAVVDTLKIEKFPLLGISCGAAVAVAYAAKHPERVSKLILFGGYRTSYLTTGNPDAKIIDEAETLLKIAGLGWGTGGSAFRQVFVSKFMPNATQQQQHDFDEYQRLTATPEMAMQCLRAMFNINVKEEAKRISCPCLFFHARGDQLILFEQGRKLASSIPGAKFVPLDSENHVPFDGEPCWATITQQMRLFLGESPVQATAAVLTKRQAEVLRLVSQGFTDKRIAKELSLSPRTVEMHVASVLKQLKCVTRAEAVHIATARKLLTTVFMQ